MAGFIHALRSSKRRCEYMHYSTRRPYAGVGYVSDYLGGKRSAFGLDGNLCVEGKTRSVTARRRSVWHRFNSVFEFIKGRIYEKGYAPSVREVCADLNIKSTSTAQMYIDRNNETLEASKGTIVLQPFTGTSLIFLNFCRKRKYL